VNAYAFGRAAPQIPRGPDVAGPLKEWGESAEDDEVFYMDDLSEFESTSLDDLEHITNTSSLDKRSRSPVAEQPSKRQKLDVMPLDEVIPEVSSPLVMVSAMITHVDSVAAHTSVGGCQSTGPNETGSLHKNSATLDTPLYTSHLCPQSIQPSSLAHSC
jgi:hypothetical protein